MRKMQRFRKKTNDFLYDHYLLKGILTNTNICFFALISAFIFAFGFCSFVLPGTTPPEHSIVTEPFNIVTGGVSGLSQCIAKIFEMFSGKELSPSTISGIGYFVINVPILIFAFFAIGKKFAIFSAVNVAASAILIIIFPQIGFTNDIANNPLIYNYPIVRVLCGGLCVGLASALAFRVDISSGGVDVVTYYMALRKSTSVGKYSLLVNGVVISIYALLIIVDQVNHWPTAIISLFHSIFYLIITSMVIDLINLRNKKVHLQFITSKPELPNILLSRFPHSSTVVKGKGTFSGADKLIIYMVVSSFEMKKVVKVARNADPYVFCTVTSLVQVYGNFFQKPVD